MSALPLKADTRALASTCPLCAASSTGRRNTGVKFLCRGFKSQGLAWPLIELAGHFVEMGLRVHRQVGSFRKILSQDRKSTRLNSSHSQISYAVFCLKKKKKKI